MGVRQETSTPIVYKPLVSTRCKFEMMQGIDQVQRSNAVGQHTSYLPDADPGRQGGNTYTGASTEPTIQDYENFFGPSARDIKTDLQRFKRHGRWHLPDILKGPNPWLTDRIDGLITDATNSPFTTKILPYRYKDDVDGKMKWNVWSFDEGMASRVPYEAAARTLTQSKRSFAGYMVRQGMAIVMEHNFMMTPKGRENFKNQLNQLIGSIQYTNDLDVHMALILAPSYQKTMRERYFTLDKTASQICREFVDLFGMMQKNVNALDILIEEGKAVLRTWGGPMPDFLLCNSKLTFQMTMTPEKTNYITQGSDGVKRLRQGPDLTTYRGLSVVHSRSFAMEVGQHPRDVLRRRVRTAEYYRILPNPKNAIREFEFYNEERDNWFTLSFADLLRYARYYGETRGESDGANSAAVDRVYNSLTAGVPEQERIQKTAGGYSRHGQMTVGANLQAFARDYGGIVQSGELHASERGFIDFVTGALQAVVSTPLITDLSDYSANIDSDLSWILTPFRFDMGIRHIHPRDNRIWNAWEKCIHQYLSADPKRIPVHLLKNSLGVIPKLSKTMMKHMYLNLKSITLNDPFSKGDLCKPNTAEWFSAYTFYLDLYKRAGFPLDFVEFDTQDGLTVESIFQSRFKTQIPSAKEVDISCQMLRLSGAVGNVNHPLFFSESTEILGRFEDNFGPGWNYGNQMLLTVEILGPLVREYLVDGLLVSGIDLILKNIEALYHKDIPENYAKSTQSMFQRVYDALNAQGNDLITKTLAASSHLQNLILYLLNGAQPSDPGTIDAVYMARAGINTWSMGLTSMTHFLHPIFASTAGPQYTLKLQSAKENLRRSYGYLNLEFLNNMLNDENVYWVDRREQVRDTDVDVDFMKSFWRCISSRISADVTAPIRSVMPDISMSDLMKEMPAKVSRIDLDCIKTMPRYIETMRREKKVLSRISPVNLNSISIDMNEAFSGDEEEKAVKQLPKKDLDKLQDVELVIVRPNIEHNMLGIIMGLGGETLGNTLWGQTELSVYDDSMHGIWGMSYKYHERAIVFNERNLIRLWDIAYDGYNGGKDDTYVDWMRPDAPNGYKNFQELTMDVSKNYRGPSMMVMAFVHDRSKLDLDGHSYFEKHYKRNWPSPIVFHDNYNEHSAKTSSTLPLDYDNLQVVDVDEFRVFNNPLYAAAYTDYKSMMPAFHDMHIMRKSAGQASAEAETQTDSLAFQGSMRVKENGIVLQDIQGSGHHGPDYTGVASVRAGKGQKVSGQAPTLHRLI
jgi:hypothetical protein